MTGLPSARRAASRIVPALFQMYISFASPAGSPGSASESERNRALAPSSLMPRAQAEVC